MQLESKDLFKKWAEKNTSKQKRRGAFDRHGNSIKTKQESHTNFSRNSFNEIRNIINRNRGW
jgi:hypothetical protein